MSILLRSAFILQCARNIIVRNIPVAHGWPITILPHTYSTLHVGMLNVQANLSRAIGTFQSWQQSPFNRGNENTYWKKPNDKLSN